MTRKIDAGMGNEAIRLFATMDTTKEDRVVEFIDNSISSYLYHKKKHNFGNNFVLKIKCRLLKSSISISDNAGGIADKDLDRAFVAYSVPENTKLLNEFGVGMKMAAHYFGKKWSVNTSAFGEKIRWEVRIDEDKMAEVPNGEMVQLNLKDFPAKITQHFTTITINPLRKERSLSAKDIKKIKQKLSSRYRNFFTDQNVKIYIDDGKTDELLKYEEPVVRYRERYQDILTYSKDKKVKPKKIKWQKKFEIVFGKNKYRVKCNVMILEKSRSDGSTGFYYFRKKLCLKEADRPEDIYTDPGSQSTKTLLGEFIFPDHMPVLGEKTNLNWTSQEKEEFVRKVKNVLEEKKFNLLSESRLAGKKFDHLWDEINKTEAENTKKTNDNADVKHLGNGMKTLLTKRVKPIFPAGIVPKTEQKTISFRGYSFKIETYGSDELNSAPFVTYKKAKDYNTDSKKYIVTINLSIDIIKHYFLTGSNQIETITGLKLLGLFLVQSAIESIHKNRADEKDFKHYFDNLNTVMVATPPKIDDYD